MPDDTYKLNSGVVSQKRVIKRGFNVVDFINRFEKFENKIKTERYPMFRHDMVDAYGFYFLLKECNLDDYTFDKNLKCEQIYNHKGKKDNKSIKKRFGKYEFEELLNLIKIGFLFDYDKAVKIYENQHDPLTLFLQIVNSRSYVQNRYDWKRKTNFKRMMRANNANIHLDNNKPIELPHVWYFCDGMVPPYIIQKNYNDMVVAEGECHAFGDGTFIVSGGKIIDCLRINDTWMTDLPLEQRLKVAVKCNEFEVATYMKAWNLKEAFNCAEILKCNRDEGVLLRCAHEDFWNNRWFNWCKYNYLYCYKEKKNKIIRCKNINGKQEKDYFTLEGYEALVDPYEKPKYDRIFLDDIDVEEFQRILFLPPYGVSFGGF